MFKAARERNKQEVVNAAISIAQRNNWNPQDLVAIVSYETGGKFGPWQAGPTTQWGEHRGLIQWGEPQREQYGVTRTMSIAEQMEKVAEYLVDNGVKPGDGLLSMYAAVNAGDAKKTGATDENNGGRPGSVAEKVQGKEFAGHIERAQQLVDKYANPSTMNGFTAAQPNIIDGVTQLSSAGAVATPTARPDPYASRMANQYGQYRQATMPEMAFAPGGLFDYTRAAADMMPGFDPQEAGQNLQASLAMDMSGTAPAYPETPRSYPSVTPQVASAPGGLFQPTGAFNNINQTQPTGSFNPTSPFGNGLAAASPAKSGVEQFYDPQQVQRVNEIDKWEQARNAAAKPSAPVSPVTPAVSTAYQNYAASRMAAPATAVPASRAAGIDVVNSAMSLADQYASYGAGKVAPAPMQTASSATQAAPPMDAPRTVAPREVRQYTPPAPVAPTQPAMTPERARALGMVPTVPGKYMPDVKANPAQVMRDQLGLIAANPFEALARMAMGTLQGGVFHAGNTLGNIASAPGGLFGGSTAPGGGYSGGGYSGSFGGGGYSGTGYSGRDANPAPGGGFGGFQSDSGFTYDR